MMFIQLNFRKNLFSTKLFGNILIQMQLEWKHRVTKYKLEIYFFLVDIELHIGVDQNDWFPLFHWCYMPGWKTTS